MSSAPVQEQQLHKAVIPAEERPPLLRLVFARTRVSLLLLGTMLLWEAVTRFFDVPNYLLPAPQDLVEEFTAKPDLYLEALLITTTEAIVGFSLAVGSGLLLAVVIARSALVEELLYPYLNILRALPTVAIAPLLMIWFGHGMTPMVIIAASIAFFPIVVTTVLGLKSVDPDLVSLMRTLNATEGETFRKIRLPNALPFMFSAFRISAPLAVIGALVGEFVGGTEGLGYILVTGSAQLNTSAVFVMTVLAALLGVVFFSAVVVSEQRAIRWHPSSRDRAQNRA